MVPRSGLWRSVACGCLAALSVLSAATAQAQDAIVGTWVGMLKQDDGEPFETRLTFVSPKGGVSRYPASPCGGILAGGPKGDGYQFTETITWGTTDELKAGCIGGVADISVSGDVMKFDWSTVWQGNETRTVGELKRQGIRKR
ncbi:MAG: hypothetical protein WC684_10930 [Hyphomicrobium sp.]